MAICWLPDSVLVTPIRRTSNTLLVAREQTVLAGHFLIAPAVPELCREGSHCNTIDDTTAIQFQHCQNHQVKVKVQVKEEVLILVVSQINGPVP